MSASIVPLFASLAAQDLLALAEREIAIDREVETRCYPRPRTTGTGRVVQSQPLPRLAKLLKTYLKSTAPDASLKHADYDWLLETLWSYLIRQQLGSDIEEDALRLALEIVGLGSADALDEMTEGVFVDQPELEAGYRTHMRWFKGEVRNHEPGLDPEDHDFLVYMQTMQLVWLAEHSIWSAGEAPDLGYEDMVAIGEDHTPAGIIEQEICPGRGGLSLLPR